MKNLPRASISGRFFIFALFKMKKLILTLTVLYFSGCVSRHDQKVLNSTNFTEWNNTTLYNFHGCCQNPYFIEMSDKFVRNISDHQLRQRMLKLIPRFNGDFNTFTYLHILEAMAEPVDTHYSATIWFDDTPIYYVFTHTGGDSINFEKVDYKSLKFDAYKNLIDNKWNTIHTPCCPEFTEGKRGVGSFSTIEMKNDTAFVVGNWVNMN